MPKSDAELFTARAWRRAATAHGREQYRWRAPARICLPLRLRSTKLALQLSQTRARRARVFAVRVASDAALPSFHPQAGEQHRVRLLLVVKGCRQTTQTRAIVRGRGPWPRRFV